MKVTKKSIYNKKAPKRAAYISKDLLHKPNSSNNSKNSKNSKINIIVKSLKLSTMIFWKISGIVFNLVSGIIGIISSIFPFTYQLIIVGILFWFLSGFHMSDLNNPLTAVKRITAQKVATIESYINNIGNWFGKFNFSKKNQKEEKE